MDHVSFLRPPLPATTPATLISTKRNPYASTSTPSLMRDVVEVAAEPVPMQTKVLRKLIAKLPFELRESVGSAVEMVLQQSELARKDLELSHQELFALRVDLKKKSLEVDNLQKMCEVFRQKKHGLEDTLDEMKDNMDSRQKHLVKNRRSVDRMASTNRMLIDSLDALQNKQTHAVSRQPLGAESEGKSSGLPVQSTGTSDKLRESLLRVSREHYRSIKQVEVMEQSVDDLKAALKAAEQKNRQLKLEIDELQSHHSDHATERGASMIKENAIGAPPRSSSRSFSKLDERFQGLISKQAVDPIEGLAVLRRLLAYMACAPTSLDFADVAHHLASREILRIFDAELVCVFLVPKGNPQVLHKYTPRSREPEVVHIKDNSCLASETCSLNQVSRINSMSRVHTFNVDVDCCPGVTAKRLISVPLFDNSRGKMLGCVHMINKTKSGVVYSEADEIFTQIFADHAAGLLSTCHEHLQMETRAVLLESLLEASTDIFNAIPDKDSLLADRDLNPGDLLATIEDVCRRCLKCSKARAFLTSSGLGMESGQLIVIDSRIGGSVKTPTVRLKNNSVRTIGDYSGIVGSCLRTKTWKQAEGLELDAMLNPQVDLDPCGLPLVTVPVFNIDGKVIACLQLVPGPQSPKFFSPVNDEEDNVNSISFQQAVHWFVHQISHPLNFLLGFIGKRVQRPLSTPSRLSTPVFSVQNFMTSSHNLQEPDFESVNASTIDLTSVLDESGSKKSRQSRSTPADAEGAGTVITSLETLNSLVLEAGDWSRKQKSVVNLVAQVLERAQGASEQTSQLRSELQLARQDAEACRSELEIASSGYARGVAELDRQVVRMRENESQMQEEIIELRMRCQEKELTQQDQDREKAALLSSVHSEYRAQLTDLNKKHDETLANWKTRSDNQESLIQRHQKTISSLNTELASLQVAVSTQATQLTDFQSQIRILEIRNFELQESEQRNQEQSQQLTHKLAEKDSLVTILQEQLVKMAENNLADINSAARQMLSETSKSTKDGFVPPVPVNDKSEVQRISSSQSIGSATLSEQGSARSTKIAVAPTTPPPERISRVSSLRDDVDNPVPVAFDLPEGWTQMSDENGQSYYFNAITGESSWDLPGANGTEAVLVGDWLQQVDAEGREYWVNQVTGASEWELPSDATGENTTRPHTVAATAGGYTIEL